MPPSRDQLIEHLLNRVRQVQMNLGVEPAPLDNADVRFADLLDSMGMVEFLMILARDCGVNSTAIEECVQRRFGTVRELADSMQAAGFLPHGQHVSPATILRAPSTVAVSCWLAATAVRLPDSVQSAAELNAALQRPTGWLEDHAGIQQRRTWADQDALAAAAEAGRECLTRTGVPVEQVGALLVTSEAPPLLAGLAAVLHHRLALQSHTVALEIGGACTGFLAALWTAQALIPQVGAVLVITVEAPSRYLHVQPGPAGQAAALFGDAAAAVLLCGQPAGNEAVPLAEVVLGTDGSAARLIQVQQGISGLVELRLEGVALAERAVRGMAQSVQDLTQKHGLAVADLLVVVAHGGNGRMPALLAR